MNLNDLGQYTEDGRIEAKKALGGLPQSIWETYSAFANTMGGVILLGVEELPDKRLHPVELPDPHWLAKEFLREAQDPKNIYPNILTEEDVRPETVDGKTIVAIYIPQAAKDKLPVYIGGDPLTGSYYRFGEGDFRFTAEEVRAMQGLAAKGEQAP